MPRAGADERDFVALAHWFVREVGPRLSAWVDGEGVKVEARALQARANRARAIGEVDDHVHAFLIMSTAQALRWCWAEGLGVSGRAWVKPDGEVVQAPNGHVQWVTENMDNLIAQGLAPQDPAKRNPQATSISLMMDQGWVRYSGGQITSPKGMPSAAQVAALDGLIKQVGAPAGFSIDLLIGKQFLSVPASEVEAQGLEAVLSRIGTEHRADMGGGTDGPQQQGDGCDVGHNFMETVQDGSTAPFERSYRYMKQDFTPEVWWSRQLLDYLSHNFPGKKDVSGPEPDAGSIPSATGPGQQFASAVKTVLTAMEREADATDPSDTDGQHDQLNEDSMSTHLLDPGSILYKRQKGRGAPAGDPSGAGDGEMHTHLGAKNELWAPDPEIVKVNYRKYKCDNCGNIQPVQTNHLGAVMEYCGGCSWKPSEGQGYSIPALGGQTYRKFVYVGEIENWDKDFAGQKTREGVQRSGSFKSKWLVRLSDKALEQQIIQMEKDHLEPQQITRELREDGVPTQVIDETYDNRDKNLVKVVEVTI